MNNKKTSSVITLTVIITIILITVSAFIIVKTKNKSENEEVIDGGVIKDGRLKGYSEVIKSKNIVSFSYSNSDYKLSSNIINGELVINASGDNKEDGINFDIEYNSNDKNILNELQSIIEKYELTKNNGYEREVAGLPPGYGDKLSVVYDSDEKIWKYSNQIELVSENAVKEIYEVFHKNAIENGYDFNTTNVIKDEVVSKDYLNGTWEGKCSSNNYKVEFNNAIVKIYQNDVLTDTYVYNIVDNVVVKFKLKSNTSKIDNYNNYDSFRDIVNFRKENSVFYAYFKDYSKCELNKKE